MMNTIHQTINNADAIASGIALAGAMKQTIVRDTATVTVVPMFRLKTV